MGKVIYSLAIAGIVLFAGLAMSPSINSILRSTDTTGFSYLLTAAVTFLPYALVGIIIVLVYKASKGEH